MASGKRKRKTDRAGRALLRGAAVGIASLLLLILLFALLIFLGWLPESSISIGNTVIKILSVLAAGAATGLGQGKTPWYFGGIAAALAIAAAVACMSIYLGAFQLTWNMAADLLMAFAIGSAASAVLQKRKAE